MTKPDCNECGGACCRYVIMKVPPMGADEARWAGMRGVMYSQTWAIRSKCDQLKDGRCVDYESRPDVCRQYACGGKLCKAAMRRYKQEQGGTNGKA
jgi:Fe-S-cluster containining protein